MESLPTTIGQLQHLTKLRLTSCKNLKELPQSVTSLSSWSMLDLSFYNSIEAIPTMIGQLQHLARLWLIDCENLKEHFQSIARLFSLLCWTYLVVTPLNHYQQRLVNRNIWPTYYWNDVKIFSNFLEALQASPH